MCVCESVFVWAHKMRDSAKMCFVYLSLFPAGISSRTSVNFGHKFTSATLISSDSLCSFLVCYWLLQCTLSFSNFYFPLCISEDINAVISFDLLMTFHLPIVAPWIHFRSEWVKVCWDVCEFNFVMKELCPALSHYSVGIVCMIWIVYSYHIVTWESILWHPFF